MPKVLRWLLFGVIVSILPLVFAYFVLLMNPNPTAGSNVTGMSAVLGNGELLVVTWVLAAGAIGEVIGSDEGKGWFKGRGWLKIVSGGLTLIVLIFATLFFAAIAEARAVNVKVEDSFVSTSSIDLFLISLVPCFICVASTEVWTRKP